MSRSVFGDGQNGGRGGVGSSERRERERTGETGAGGEGVPGLFDGAIGPEGDGPCLDAEARAARGGEVQWRGGLHGALRPRDISTDAERSGGGEVAEPVKRDGGGGENGEGKEETGEQMAQGYFLGTDFFSRPGTGSATSKTGWS
jgi:hypothetical protein